MNRTLCHETNRCNRNTMIMVTLQEHISHATAIDMRLARPMTIDSQKYAVMAARQDTVASVELRIYI